jgi:TolB-like protein
MSGELEQIYEFGQFRLNCNERCLSRDGKCMPLTAQVFDILLLLVQRRGQVVTKDELMSVIWPDSFVEENNLTVRISALRKTLSEGEGGRRYVETVHGRGYRFVAKVHLVAYAEPPQPVKGRGGEEPGHDDAPPHSVAVLPFCHEEGEPNLSHLADGITEDIINRLSQLPQLKVMARSTVIAYKEQAVKPQEVGRLLGVRAILVGRALQFGERLVVAVELMDVKDGAQIWGERFNRQPSDIFAFQEEVAKDVVSKLQAKLLDGGAGDPPGALPSRAPIPPPLREAAAEGRRGPLGTVSNF